MELLASPAMLGGIIAGVALGAWSLGRWQGAAWPVTDPRSPAPGAEHPPFEWRASVSHDPSPAVHSAVRSAAPIAGLCQQARRAERNVALEPGFSLGDLHAEVSAYRQQQQVFAAVTDYGLRLDLLLAEVRRDCRSAVPIRQESCLTHGAPPPPCGCTAVPAEVPAPLWAERAVQLSPAASGLTLL